ncbi:MAG: hypothetical protein JSR17_10440 [Proteobacteria bacterium]|nr:hypothetical protein [Pseudomonadota bacterium]
MSKDFEKEDRYLEHNILRQERLERERIEKQKGKVTPENSDKKDITKNENTPSKQRK